jgi:hypothetical protein
MKRKPSPTRPKLRFTPTAWAKLKFLRDLGPTEIGGFGISHPSDLLLIEDFRLVQQQTHPAYVAFDDQAVADFFDEQVDLGLRPEQFGRIWIHTHPGESPAPSVTDHETFDRVFGATQWSVMFILARHGATHAELRYQAGPPARFKLATGVDYSADFRATDRAAWKAEFERCVRPFDERFCGDVFDHDWPLDLNHALPPEELDDIWYYRNYP